MTSLMWLIFIASLLLILMAALRVFDRAPRVVSFRVSLAWTAFWMVLAIAFSIVIRTVYHHQLWGFGIEPGYPHSGEQAMAAFLGVYFLETCFNLDNVFGAALIFTHFGVRLRLQYRVLYWGVLAAFLVRGLMIGFFAQGYQWFPWFNFVLGAVVLLCAMRLLIARHERVRPAHNLAVRAARRLLPVTEGTEGGRFFARIDGRWFITPLFIALLLIESSDTVFAFDSVPASFAVTRDPFLIFSAHTFAILGMRSLYFALLGFIDRFYYLRASLVALLVIMAVQLFAQDYAHVPLLLLITLAVAVMGIGVIASIFSEKRPPEPLAGAYTDELEEYALLTWRQGRKVVVLVVGSTVVLVGVAMILLPGPAFVVIPAGLALLATEFVWARKLLQRLKNDAGGIISYVRHFTKGVQTPPDKGPDRAGPGE